MDARAISVRKIGGLFVAFVLFLPALGLAGDTRVVDCDAGDRIGGAPPMLKPGDTLLVRGTCVENVEVSAETGQFDGTTLSGQGTATKSEP